MMPSINFDVGERPTTVTLVAALVVCGLFAWKGCSDSGKLRDTQSMYEALSDTLSAYRDDAGRMVAEIATITSERTSAFLELQTADSTVIRLQDLVREYRGRLASATVAGTETTETGVTTTIVTRVDTVREGDTVQLWPEYATSWDERWSTGVITAGRDSIARKIQVRNEYSITEGAVSDGFLRRTREVQFRNENPNTVTTELRSYAVVERKRRFGLGVHAGYGLSLQSGQLEPYVGVGLGFNLVEF